MADGGLEDWMSRLPEELLNIPLWDLAIPGSHDSMSYCLDVASPVLRSEPRVVTMMDVLFPCWTRPYVARWATTQECTISHQCDLGVRFFDLRIAKKPTSGKMYFHHGLYTRQDVKEALTALVCWLDRHPAEVAVLCCSHFDSLTDSDHAHLVHDIRTIFANKMCPSEDIPTIRSCLSKGQQVIVSYDDQTMTQQHPLLWKNIPYRYADSSDPNSVISYLEEQKSKGRPDGFFVSGLNLTEDGRYVASHLCSSMKRLTLGSLSPLLAWASEQRPGPWGGAVNILCSDFTGLSRFCSLVIGLNHSLLGGAP